MFLHGDHDYVVPIEAIRNIYEKIDNKNKKIIEVKNGSHWILSTKLEDDIYNKIKDFLNK
jgi:esterase/lipase